MSLKVSLIFCIIFTLWTSSSRARRTGPRLIEISEVSGGGSCRTTGGAWSNDHNHIIPNVEIEKYGYGHFTESTRIIVGGYFEIDIEGYSQQSSHELTLFSKTSSKDEKIYEGKVCDYRRTHKLVWVVAQVLFTLKISKHGDSTLFASAQCRRDYNWGSSGTAKFNITNVAVLNNPGYFDGDSEVPYDYCECVPPLHPLPPFRRIPCPH